MRKSMLFFLCIFAFSSQHAHALCYYVGLSIAQTQQKAEQRGEQYLRTFEGIDVDLSCRLGSLKGEVVWFCEDVKGGCQQAIAQEQIVTDILRSRGNNQENYENQNHEPYSCTSGFGCTRKGNMVP